MTVGDPKWMEDFQDEDAVSLGRLLFDGDWACCRACGVAIAWSNAEFVYNATHDEACFVSTFKRKTQIESVNDPNEYPER